MGLQHVALVVVLLMVAATNNVLADDPSVVVSMIDTTHVEMVETETSTTTEPVVVEENVSPIHRNDTLTQLDVKIHDLEEKLESDLQRVEADAKRTPKTQQRMAWRNKTGNETELDKDLGLVRSDIHDLVLSIEAAEHEVEVLKTRVELEERVLRQKSADMETEKILDDLHRGKLNVKIDYVTGKIIANSQKETPKIGSAASKEATHQLNETTTLHSMDDTTNATILLPVGGDEAGAVLSAEDAENLNMERALENIIEAVSVQQRPRKRGETEEDVDMQETKQDAAADRIEMNPDLKWRVQEEIESIRAVSDPAVLSMDVPLLLDIVKLAMTAAFFGLTAVFLRLPPTAGFLLGGMLIGPSCLDLIGEINQVQTLAQFGMIFLLFEQGLLYSQTYSGAAILGSSLSTGLTTDVPTSTSPTTVSVVSPRNTNSLHSRWASGVRKTKSPVFASSTSSVMNATFDTDHDPNIVGAILLILLIFTALAIVVLTDDVSSVPEAIIVSSCIALCSTTIVSENLHATHVANTHWGKGVLKMISMHDLFMVPLLAMPEILAFIDELDNENTEETGWLILQGATGHMILVIVFLKGAIVLSKHLVGAANLAQSRMMGEKGELFTLSIVAYALFVASLAEHLKLSIEAGAVLAGIVLMKSPHVPKVLASIQPITSVFGGMYLTSLGMIISPSFVVDEAGSIIELVCLIGLFKLALVSTVLNRFFDYGITASIAVGSAMAQISEASLLVLAKAQRLGLVSRKTYLLLIPTTCIMLTLAPLSAGHLRRLKMQEVSGSDDGRIPYYLCFLKHLNILRHPKRTNIPQHSTSGQELEEETGLEHLT